MFRYEKDMIPVLKEFFNKNLEVNLSVEELNTGIGIADIVFSEEINKRDYYFDNFEILFHTLNLLNRKNKKIPEELFFKNFSKKQRYNIIDKYIAMELIENKGANFFYVKNKLEPSITKFYAIEAKLKDWKGGFYQAMRYKNFAQKSYLALSSDFIHRVDKELFIENNIGLISVSHEETKIIINPRKRKPKDKIAFYYLGEMFTKSLFQNQQYGVFSPQQWI